MTQMDTKLAFWARHEHGVPTMENAESSGEAPGEWKLEDPHRKTAGNLFFFVPKAWIGIMLFLSQGRSYPVYRNLMSLTNWVAQLQTIRSPGGT
jgi:hypothetical protein